MQPSGDDRPTLLATFIFSPIRPGNPGLCHRLEQDCRQRLGRRDAGLGNIRVPIHLVMFWLRRRLNGYWQRPKCLIGRPIRMSTNGWAPRFRRVTEFQTGNFPIPLAFLRYLHRSCAMSILKWALIFFVVSIVAGILGFTGVSAASADVARVLFYIFVVIFIVLLLLGITIFRA
jgi:uncharacterized membrane protein YtjA (UPF0391 family)